LGAYVYIYIYIYVYIIFDFLISKCRILAIHCIPIHPPGPNKTFFKINQNVDQKT